MTDTPTLRADLRAALADLPDEWGPVRHQTTRQWQWLLHHGLIERNPVHWPQYFQVRRTEAGRQASEEMKT
jgi:hypothetical protein